MLNTVVKSFILCGALASQAAWADWQIDNDLSQVNFTSVKNNAIAENHHFKALSGTLDEQGQFNVAIDLNSVETLIPIRNERMQKFVFDTVNFPHMTVTANVAELLKQAQKDGVAQGSVKAKLDLHGKTLEQEISVHVATVNNGRLVVSSLAPVLVTPSDFALNEGVDKLKSLAGLSSITRAVPVSFVLTLNEQ